MNAPPKDTQFELHLSTTNGFTPSSSTLYSVGAHREMEVGNLDPAKTWYGVVIPITWQGGKPVRGQPSEQFTFTPGRAHATQLNPNVQWGRLPLNGGFETRFDTNKPPDFWFASGSDGADWDGTHVTLGTSSGLEGSQYVKIKANTTGSEDPAIFSAEFSINELVYYAASCWRKTVSGSGNNVIFGIIWYDIDHVSISGSTESFSLGDSVGTWVQTKNAAVAPPSGARFARAYMQVDGDGAATREVHLDSVEVKEVHSHARAKTASAGSYVTGDVLQYATEDHDTLSEYSTGSYTFTAKRAGYYRASAAIFAASQAYVLGESVQLMLEKNSTTIAYGTRAFAPSTASWYLTSNLDTTLYLAVGDTLRCSLSHDRSGGNVTLFTDAKGNYFSVDRLSD